MPNPPALMVRRNFRGQPEDLVNRLRDVPTGWVVDANGRRGAVDYRVRPLTSAMRFCGVALTVQSRPRDNLAPYAAIQYAKPGDVMLIATDTYEEASVAGDVLLGMAKNQGVCALVTDGLVRDIDGLNAVGIPVFARGLSPNSPHKDGPGKIGLPIYVGGVMVNCGRCGDRRSGRRRRRRARGARKRARCTRRCEGQGRPRWKRWSRQAPTLPPGFEQLLAEKGVQYLD